MTLKIVTDSTCDLPPSVIAEWDITVVPVYVNVGAASYLDGQELARKTFYDNLYTYDTYPTTAAPAAGAFTAVYEQLTAAGATAILSIHLAASLSNTFNAARLGAEAANSAPVTLFDARQITVGTGALVLLAARAAADGRSLPEIVALLEASVPHTYVFGMIDTLESLRRSGRVNWATFGIGSLLQIKPVMMIHQGEISVVARVRTRKRALPHVVSLMSSLHPFTQLYVIHVHAPEGARELADMAEAGQARPARNA